MRKASLPILIVCFVALVSSCGATLSNKAKATMILSTYNSMAQQTAKEAEDCLARGQACSESERQNIRMKKEKIVKLDRLVDPYAGIIASGGIPSMENEQEIYDLIDELTALGL